MTADNQIQQALQDDNPKALDLIYDTYGSALYGYLSCLVCRVQDTEDCFQNLFIRIAEKRHLLCGKEKLKAYLMTMARNEAMGLFRRQKRDINTVWSEDAFLVATTEDSIPVEELSRSLAALPCEQREVITLKIFHSMTFEEIGHHLNVSQNTAASRYRYGLSKMKESMLELLS